MVDTEVGEVENQVRMDWEWKIKRGYNWELNTSFRENHEDSLQQESKYYHYRSIFDLKCLMIHQKYNFIT